MGILPLQLFFERCRRVTDLLAKDHDDLSFAFQVTIFDFLDRVIRLAFSECCRVDADISVESLPARVVLTRSQSSRRLQEHEDRKHTIDQLDMCFKDLLVRRDDLLGTFRWMLPGHYSLGGSPRGPPTRSHLHRMPLLSSRSISSVMPEGFRPRNMPCTCFPCLCRRCRRG
jgi:hypothetical protein